MTITGDLDVILERNGVAKEQTQKCIKDIFDTLLCADFIAYLSEDLQERYCAALDEIERKIVYSSRIPLL